MRNFSEGRFFIFATLLLSSSAFAGYRCQVTTRPDIFYRDLVWDGSTPFVTPFEYQGDIGELRVKSIGLAGHPDYLFELHWHDKSLLSVSQERNLKDYNITWQSDGSRGNELVSVACRTNGI